MKFKPSRLVPFRATAVTLALAATLGLNPARAATTDLDGDGIANRIDPDVDGDGILNGADRNVDGGVCKSGPFKGQYVGDRLKNGSAGEKDIDDDGLDDDSKREKDIDGDGLPDDSDDENDIDGDGRDDDSDREKDIDGDGRDDDSKGEKDIDGDGRKDDVDDDIDGDGEDNGDDDDCDGDGEDADQDDNDDGDDLDDDLDDDDNGDGYDDDDLAEIKTPLTATASAPAGSLVTMKVTQYPTGGIELEFEGRNLAAGNYDVVVNGQVIGQLSMEDDDGETEGEVEFETLPDDDDVVPLPFDPIGKSVTIVQGAITYFTGTVPTPALP